jgi:hypothetical protein
MASKEAVSKQSRSYTGLSFIGENTRSVDFLVIIKIHNNYMKKNNTK